MQHNKNTIGILALVLAAGIAIFTAVAHISCIALGESCYRAQLAPEPIVRSAIEGTWLAPVGTSVVSLLFVLCALYALSGAKIIRRVPLLSLGIYTISVLSLLIPKPLGYIIRLAINKA